MSQAVAAPMSRHAVSLKEIREEYAEMPCLRLTLPQACRLFGLQPPEAARLLGRLMDTGFLAVTPTGQYVRSDRG